MIIIDHYVKLFLSIRDAVPGEIRQISLDDVSDILICTQRNSKLILKKLEEHQWVRWVPGNGRGNRSSIAFLYAPEALILEQAKGYVQKSQLREARKLIENYSVTFPALERQFNDWFNSLFGYQNETFDAEKRDTLRLKLSKLPIRPLDPKKITLRSECHIARHVCDTLVRYNRATGAIEPHLSFYWESADGCTWTFYLRKGVKFHDGRLLTAKDVVYSLQRLMKASNNEYSWLLDNIKDVKAVDVYIVQFDCRMPHYFLLDLLCDEHLSILPHETADQEIDRMIIGTGPYKLMENNESMLVLIAFDQYFGERPFLDRVEYWYVPESDSHPEHMDKNELWMGVYPKQMVISPNRRRQEKTTLEWNVQFLSLNLRKDGPFRNPLFRKVFRDITCPEELIEELGGAREEAAAGFIPDVSAPCHYSDPNIDITEFYNGETLHLYTFNDWDHREDAEWIVKKSKELGIHIQPTYFSEEALLREDIMREADIIHDSASIGELIEVSFLHLILGNNSFIKNHLTEELGVKIDEMVNLCYQEPERLKRLDIVKKIQQLLLEECAVLPLYRNRSYINADEMVQEASVDTQGWIDLKGIWFKKSE